MEKVDGCWRISFVLELPAGDWCHSVLLGQDASDVERSLVLDYEAKLVKKKEEVLDLLKEREELKATHKRLLSLQKKMNLGQVNWE